MNLVHPLALVDSHCHLDFECFDDDRETVIDRAREAGVKHIVVPAITAANWGKVKSVCEQHQGLHPAYGLHPYYLEQHREQQLAQLEQRIESTPAIAIGECGLDYHLEHLDRRQQQHYFTSQLDIAQRFDLPVVIHARKSTEDIIQAIRQRSGLKGMIHSYSGSFEQAKQLVDLGFYLSFGGAITYPRATRLQRVVARLPLSSLLIETDAPDQPGATHQGERNEPAYLTEVLDVIATLRPETKEVIAEQTTRNAMNLFSIDRRDSEY